MSVHAPVAASQVKAQDRSTTPSGYHPSFSGTEHSF